MRVNVRLVLSATAVVAATGALAPSSVRADDDAPGNCNSGVKYCGLIADCEYWLGLPGSHTCIKWGEPYWLTMVGGEE